MGKSYILQDFFRQETWDMFDTTRHHLKLQNFFLRTTFPLKDLVCFRFLWALLNAQPSRNSLRNSNWTERSTIQGVIARVISKSDEREARGRFEITRTITP